MSACTGRKNILQPAGRVLIALSVVVTNGSLRLDGMPVSVGGAGVRFGRLGKIYLGRNDG